VASVGSFVGLLLAFLGGAMKSPVLIGVFRFARPMVFGMASLCSRRNVGETLVDQRLAGSTSGSPMSVSPFSLRIQFVTAGILRPLFGVTLWTTGVLVFVGSLLVTVGPTAVDTVTGTLGKWTIPTLDPIGHDDDSRLLSAISSSERSPSS